MATQDEILAFLAREFPKRKWRVQKVGDRSATLVYPIGSDELRPGGTVYGPVMMTVADVALYAALLGEIGIVPLAVTTNLSINFLRRPSADRDIVGVCKLLKVGRSLAVGEVLVYSQGDPQIVAHAMGTYSIPPKR